MAPTETRFDRLRNGSNLAVRGSHAAIPAQRSADPCFRSERSMFPRAGRQTRPRAGAAGIEFESRAAAV